jgi:thiamine biosynthesis lipoprotein
VCNDTGMMRTLLVTGMLSLTLTGCGNDHAQFPLLELTGSTMGTSYNVKLVALPSQTDAEALQAQIDNDLSKIEQRMSTYRTGSELSLFNRSEATDWVEVSAELCGVVEQALSVSEITSAFDITVGPLVNLWGFGPDETLPEPPENDVIEEALQYTGFAMLHTQCMTPAIRKDRAEIYVDLSAYAKGYAVDQIAMLLSDQGLNNFMVEIGGELRMHGHNADGKLWSVAIEKPAEFESAVQIIVQTTDVAIATSGDYRNFYQFAGQRYSHTIDPKTGYPVTHKTAAVSVISDTAAFADAMATALLVLGVDEGLALAEREGIAAYFMLRTDSGMEAYSTAAFAEATDTQ